MPLPGILHRLQSSRGRYLVLGLLLFLAAISTLRGAQNAIQRSQDFQWSPTAMLLHHVDPWRALLDADQTQHFYATGVPNYLPVLYVLIAPIGFLPLLPAKIAWLLCNLVFATASAIIAARFYGLRRRSVLAVVFLMLMATPTRNCFGNGQQCLLVLFVWCLALLSPRLTNTRTGWSGISYFKFNFAPALFLYLLIRGGIRAVVMSAIPSLIATLAVWLWLTGGHDPRHLLHIVTDPFAVSRIGYFPSGSDMNLMDVLETLLNHLHTPATIVKLGTLGAAVIVCAVVLYRAIRRHRTSSTQWHMALMAIMSFGLFKHHAYDSVVLLLPLCYALRLWKDRRAQIVIVLIAYLWYFQRFIDGLHLRLSWLFVVQFAMLMVVLAMTYRLRPFEEQAEPSWQAAS